MGKQLNAKESKVNIEELNRRKNGDKEQLSPILTDGEKVQMSVMLEKLNLLQAQLRQVQIATSELVTTIVKSRGLNPKEYGVNLAAGKVVPIETGAPKEKAKS